jgi:3-hydroxyacyl-[acyl-carrier-protein] dehydratase
MIYNSDQIQQIIPHRYPFLLVDQILSIEDQKIVGIKAVSANEMHFLGHFPQKHVMPGVLIMEALAQTGAVLLLSQEQFKENWPTLRGWIKSVSNAKSFLGMCCVLK